MANLRDTRSGWANEHLARYLLSRVSFLSSPIFVGDDIGVDVICTLFEPRMVNGKEQLFPRQAFAIQLKSKFEEVEVKSDSSALPTLEIPFFLGVIERDFLSLAIYSGEMLPDYLSSVARQDRFLLSPQEEAIVHKPDWTWPKNKVGTFKVPMPLVIRMKVGEKDDEVDAKARQLLARCEEVLKNIATKTSHEYVFGYGPFKRIIAGPGSVAHFRENFMLRLAEGFYNLRFILDDRRGEFSRDEFSALEETFRKCRLLGYPRQDLVNMVYEDLHRALEREAAAGPKA